MGIPITLNVNGKLVEADIDPRTLLSDFIRVNLGLTGDINAVSAAHTLARLYRLSGGHAFS